MEMRYSVSGRVQVCIIQIVAPDPLLWTAPGLYRHNLSKLSTNITVAPASVGSRLKLHVAPRCLSRSELWAVSTVALGAPDPDLEPLRLCFTRFSTLILNGCLLAAVISGFGYTLKRYLPTSSFACFD